MKCLTYWTYGAVRWNGEEISSPRPISMPWPWLWRQSTANRCPLESQQGLRIVGFAAWGPTQIELLWVSHSDRQKGVGRVLLEQIITTPPGVSVHLDSQRRHAIDFFGTCGFKLISSDAEASEQRVILRHG